MTKSRGYIERAQLAKLSPERLFFLNTVGTAAASLSSISLIPQVYKILIYQDINGLSITSYTIFVCTSFLWLIYHVLAGTFHGAISSSFNLMSSVIILSEIMRLREKEEFGNFN